MTEAPQQRRSRKHYGHKKCQRCGKGSFSVTKKYCVSCGYGKTKRRNDNHPKCKRKQK